MAGHASSREHLEGEVRNLKDYLKLHKVHTKSIRNYDNHDYIFPISSIKAFFGDRSQVQRLLRALTRNASSPLAYDAVTPSYMRVLCILVLLGEGDCIQLFTEHASLSDQQLPFITEPSLFPKELSTRFQDFRAAQWAFCPVRLRQHNSVRLLPEEILPFVELERYKDGGSSIIYRAKIHEDYDFLRVGKTHRPTDPLLAHVYAVKSYNSDDKDARIYYQKETDAFARLRTRNLSKAHIIEFHQGFIHHDTFNIILDFAPLGTLQEFFRRQPPRNPTDITHFWSSLLSLCKAVVEFHGSESCYGWHQDIKPSNILVMGTDPTSPWKIDFKLADFGLSHFTPATGRDTVERPIAKDTWGAGEYVAPECARSTEFLLNASVLVTQGVDIWSLGCIFSEAATWVISSHSGLVEYRAKRCYATDSIDSLNAKGCFHDNFKLLEVVKDHHPTLKRSVSHGDPITSEVIDIVAWMLDPSPHTRPTAMPVANRAEKILSEARHVLASSESSNDGCSHSDAHISGVTSPSRSLASSPTREAISSLPSTPLTSHSRTFSGGSSVSATSPMTCQSCSPGDRNWSGPKTHGQLGLTDAVSNLSINLGGSCDGPRTQYIAPVEVTTSGACQDPLPDHRGSLSPPITDIPVLKFKDACDWLFTKRRKLTDHPGYAQSMAELKGRDHVFLLDDSKTMAPHWSDLKSLCKVLFEAVKEFDPNGVDFYFTVSENNRRTCKIKSTHKLAHILAAREAQKDPCDMSNRLEAIVQAYKRQLRQRHSPPLLEWILGPIRPMSIYILTDGRWPDNPENVIKRLVRQLDELQLSRTQIGLQFISFGNDPDALKRLKHLDDGMAATFDIVDTEPAKDGNVWKMLLGPLLWRFDSSN